MVFFVTFMLAIAVIAIIAGIVLIVVGFLETVRGKRYNTNYPKAWQQDESKTVEYLKRQAELQTLERNHRIYKGD